MTTPEMIRCKKCSELCITDDGQWVCLEAEEDIHEITLDDCPMEQDY